MLKLYLPFEYNKTFRVSQIFGVNPHIYKRFGLEAHNGTDWACPAKTLICAIADGQIIGVGNEGWSTGYGKYIKIQHEGYQSTYGHLKSFLVKIGDQVKQGRGLGLSDNTGFSTGAHLHLTLKETDIQGNVLNRDNGYFGAITSLPLLNMPPNPELIPSSWSKEQWDFWVKNKVLSEQSLPRATMTKEEFAVILRNYDDYRNKLGK